MTEPSEYDKAFGKHVRSLRRARGRSQKDLARLSKVSEDTIRRVESGSFSPSLTTLRKIAAGLMLPLSTLFESFELGDDASVELLEAFRRLCPRDQLIALRVCATLAEIDRSGG